MRWELIHKRARVHLASFILSGPCAPRARGRSRAECIEDNFFYGTYYFQSRESNSVIKRGIALLALGFVWLDIIIFFASRISLNTTQAG